jgi:hypothetical protein
MTNLKCKHCGNPSDNGSPSCGQCRDTLWQLGRDLPPDHQVLNLTATSEEWTPLSKLNALRAIRRKCLDCSGGSSAEVRQCAIPNCPLYPFRFGKRPRTQQRERSPAQKAADARNAERLRQRGRGADIDSGASFPIETKALATSD